MKVSKDENEWCKQKKSGLQSNNCNTYVTSQRVEWKARWSTQLRISGPQNKREIQKESVLVENRSKTGQVHLVARGDTFLACSGTHLSQEITIHCGWTCLPCVLKAD